MRKLIAFSLITALVLSVSAIALAGPKDTQAAEVKISDLIDNYALKTNWGNVYFNDRHVKKLTDSAAKLRSVNLGDFKTDKGHLVQVKAIGYKAGVATLLIEMYH